MQHARAEGTMPLSIIKDLGGVRLSYMLRNVIFDDILVVSLGSISQYHHTRRQCSPVVRILALRFRDLGFHTHSDHSLNLFHVVLGSFSWLHL